MLGLITWRGLIATLRQRALAFTRLSDDTSVCHAAYRVLKEPGAVFLTPRVDYLWEIRAFLRDPDGHLIELSQGDTYAPNWDEARDVKQ